MGASPEYGPFRPGSLASVAQPCAQIRIAHDQRYDRGSKCRRARESGQGQGGESHGDRARDEPFGGSQDRICADKDRGGRCKTAGGKRRLNLVDLVEGDAVKPMIRK